MKKGLLYLLLTALVALFAVYFFILRKPNMGLPDFNYPASKVAQIYIVDKDGNDIKLNKKDNGVWIVEDKYEANDELMGRILEDIENQKAIGKVDAKKRKQVKENLEQHYTKVKVYNKDELVLEYYIGRADASGRGNYMSMPPLNEIYDVQLPTNPRSMLYDYSTNLNNWRSIWLIDEPADNIKQVQIEYTDSPSHSFVLTNNAPQYTLKGSPEIHRELNLRRVVDYLNFYTEVSTVLIASPNTDREKILAPDRRYASLILSLKDGTVRVFEVYYHPKTSSSKNLIYDDSDIDVDLYYVYTPVDQELYVVTRGVFGKLLRFYPEFYVAPESDNS